MQRTRTIFVFFLLTITWTLACQRADRAAEAAPNPPGERAAPGAARTAPAQIASPTPPAAQGSVSVEVIPQFDHVYAPDRSLNLLVRLSGSGEVPAARPPLDLAMIIDRSGSMSGDKLRDVKTAALELIDSLRPSDRVTLISYSSDVKRHTTRLQMNERGRATLRSHLLGLSSDGGTALGPGLIAGLEQLERGAGDSLRLSHVLLFSDGLANEGEQRPEVLGARAAHAFTRGVSVSTLGVGVDYNEDLMTRLADQGGGRYHFIKDSQAIAGILEDEMTGLVATVARGMELSLASAGGVEVKRVFGYPTRLERGVTHARVGSLGAGQRREIIVRLRLPVTTPARVALGTLAVDFRDMSDDGQTRRVEVPLVASVTGDAKVARTSEHHEVTVRVAEVESAEKMELAARAAERGDFAAAQGSIDQAITELAAEDDRAPSPKLKEQIRELEEAKSEIGAARQSSAARKEYTKKFKAKAYKNRKQ